MDSGVITTGGGVKSSLWVQIKANILAKSFFVPECDVVKQQYGCSFAWNFRCR